MSETEKIRPAEVAASVIVTLFPKIVRLHGPVATRICELAAKYDFKRQTEENKKFGLPAPTWTIHKWRINKEREPTPAPFPDLPYGKAKKHGRYSPVEAYGGYAAPAHERPIF